MNPEHVARHESRIHFKFCETLSSASQPLRPIQPCIHHLPGNPLLFTSNVPSHQTFLHESTILYHYTWIGIIHGLLGANWHRKGAKPLEPSTLPETGVRYLYSNMNSQTMLNHSDSGHKACTQWKRKASLPKKRSLPAIKVCIHIQLNMRCPTTYLESSTIFPLSSKV